MIGRAVAFEFAAEWKDAQGVARVEIAFPARRDCAPRNDKGGVRVNHWRHAFGVRFFLWFYVFVGGVHVSLPVEFFYVVLSSSYVV